MMQVVASIRLIRHTQTHGHIQLSIYKIIKREMKITVKLLFEELGYTVTLHHDHYVYLPCRSGTVITNGQIQSPTMH